MSFIPHCTCGVTIGVAEITHNEDCPYREIADQSNPKLLELIEKAHETRGDIRTWVRRELVMTKFIAELGRFDRVISRGEVRLNQGYVPAVITYNSKTGSLRVLAPSGENDAIEDQRIHFFHAKTPYEGIAREVMLTTDSTETV